MIIFCILFLKMTRYLITLPTHFVYLLNSTYIFFFFKKQICLHEGIRKINYTCDDLAYDSNDIVQFAVYTYHKS